MPRVGKVSYVRSKQPPSAKEGLEYAIATMAINGVRKSKQPPSAETGSIGWPSVLSVANIVLVTFNLDYGACFLILLTNLWAPPTTLASQINSTFAGKNIHEQPEISTDLSLNQAMVEMAQSDSGFMPLLQEVRTPSWDGRHSTVYTLNYVFEYNDHIFDILLSPHTIAGYDAADSIESQYLQRMEEASFCDSEDKEEIERMFQESDRVEHEIEIKVLEVSQAIMQNEARGVLEVSQAIMQNEARGGKAQRGITLGIHATKTNEIEIKVLEVSQAIMQNEARGGEAQRGITLGIHATETGSLHTLMYPKVINLQVVTKEGKLMAIKRDDLPIYDLHPPITDPRILNISLPHYQVSTIQVIANLFSTVYKVTVDGEIMCAKLARESTHDSICDDINKLYEIQSANFPSVVRVPRLIGLVESHTGIVGYLMAYIPTYRHNLEYALRCAKTTLGADDRHRDGTPLPATTISKARREKWSSQIEETLVALHSRNIVWGDAKTANILIDEATDDAWVVDFGGGNTEGWIDHELRESVEGDQQALRRIKKELAKDWLHEEDSHSGEYPVAE
ncbi:hypothetical protein V498_04846 [Pseudogymnoascus sp. VKM F-4517 (FW-2822)]|nr:hypothetical protein V498_04846 [Pseudogymnoascus sp. VKM F-4517 (FW-2822)]